MFEILPLFFAIKVVTLPKLPGLLFKTTITLALETELILFSLSHEIFNHLSGVSC